MIIFLVRITVKVPQIGNFLIDPMSENMLTARFPGVSVKWPQKGEAYEWE